MEPEKDINSGSRKERPLVSFDWAVKRLLRDKANFEVPEGFLSELLGREVRITSVLESEGNRQAPQDKYNCVDVVVEDEAGEVILIELQFILEIDYFQRMLYGVSKAIVERMFQGDAYREIRKIYSVNIVYFDLGHGRGYAYHGKTIFTNLYDAGDTLLLSEKQQKVFRGIEAGDLYPEYYVLKINKFDNVARTPLDQWIYFLKNNRIRDDFRARGLPRAREILDYYRLSPEEKTAYDSDREQRSHYLSQVASAKDEGRWEVEKEYSQRLAEKDRALEAKDRALEGKDRALEAQGKVLEEKDRALARLAEEIEELKRRLGRQ
jgi:predicted transposase/invertase (TIGR01784 family)